MLIVNQYFPPDQSATAAVFRDLSAALAERGHSVTIMCGRPSYDLVPNKEGAELLDPVPGVRRRVLRSTTFDRRTPLKRVLNYTSFLFLVFLSSVLKKPFDVIVVGTDPPLAVAAALAIAKGRPVVYSVQDLHPDVALAAQWIRPNFLTAWWERIHRWTLRRASLVVCLGEMMAKKIEDKGVSPQRIAVIHNGSADVTEVADPVIMRELRGSSDFVLVHAGNIGYVGAWETIGASARILGTEAAFLLVGDGPRAREVAEMGLPTRPYQPLEQVASVMQAGDMQVVTLASGMEGLVVPSKIYSILAHGRPVLAIVPPKSEIALLVKKGNCGLVANPDDAEDVVRKVGWAKRHPLELAEMGRNARIAFASYERSKCMAQLAAAIEGQVVSKPG